MNFSIDGIGMLSEAGNALIVHPCIGLEVSQAEKCVESIVLGY